jgi:1,4-dihydroxy-2-naphthoate octaprenyltransferase
VMIGSIPGESWFTGSAAGFFASAVLLVNNLRDLEQDAKAGKKTLAVRLGRTATKAVLVVLLALPYVIVALLSTLFAAAPVVLVVGIMTLVIMVIVIWSRKPTELVVALGLMSVNSLLFALVLAWAIAF